MSRRSLRLVYKHSMVPTTCLLSLSSSRIFGLLIVLRQFTTWRQSVHKISYCLLLLLCSCFARCSCFAHCSHDPFIVRSASNLSTVPWFHSIFASVSMFAITDNCLSLFLFLGRYLNTTRASVQPSIPLHLHRSKLLRARTNSVYVRTTSAYLPMHARP